VSHWLDDAARGLSEGRYSRRHVIKRGSAVAAGALVGSLAGPGRAFAQARPCDSGGQCPSGECCSGLCCFSDELCCIDECRSKEYFHRCGEKCCSVYHKCCPGGHCCLKDRECCVGRAGHDCCREDELCCNGDCRPKEYFHRCGDTCCSVYDECCHSGTLAYCAPKGHCCGKGKHRVKCGSGKHLCCPEGEYCCGGKCCKPEDCQNGVCTGGGSKSTCVENCPPGAKCCPGSCTNPTDGTTVCCQPTPTSPNGIVGACSAQYGQTGSGCQGGAFGCICADGSFCPYPDQHCCYESGCCPPGQSCNLFTHVCF
jgi:hypothetical protein